ncbi:STM3941 family protein [Nannocystis punicea]|uniref:PH domain-containing protein n=1 Tax=Nannocystis punicea TaxID=2995304 RepID=A0ABY7GX91_9BACT|nr:STM3941 family protein [Nannocystis poenicansa]WAS91603.1 hypothetical protein O0S08_35935 [Nannocystis poenicansa]
MDTSRTLEILHAPVRLLGYVALALLMTAASLMLVVPAVPELAGAAFTRVIGTIGALFFGLCTCLWLRQLLTTGAVVTLSPAGLRDVRIAREVIPWSAIDRLSLWTMQNQSFVVVALAPEVEQRLTRTRIARWTRSANRRLGADGLCVSAHGLKVDLATLGSLIQAYAAAHGAPAARSSSS